MRGVRGVSTRNGDVVVVLGNNSDPEDALLLGDAWPGNYTIDRSGKYQHVNGRVDIRSNDSDSYRPRSAWWEVDGEAGVVCGTSPNHTHLDVWSKLRALRIIVVE